MVESRTIEKLHFHPRDGRRNAHPPQWLAAEVYKIPASAPATSKWHKSNCTSWPFATNNHGSAAVWLLLVSETSAQKTHDPPRRKASAALRAVENLNRRVSHMWVLLYERRRSINGLKSMWVIWSCGTRSYFTGKWQKSVKHGFLCFSCSSCNNTMQSCFHSNNAVFVRNKMPFLLTICKHFWSVTGSASEFIKYIF